MVKCNKCNAEISNTDAKFCDNCGEYLNLMSKEIKFTGKIHNKELKEFRKTLIAAVKSMQNHSIDSKWYYEIILHYLYKFTNIEKIFKSQEMNFLDIGHILSQLENCPNNLILNEFLLKVNEFYSLQKDSYNKELMNIILYTNVNPKLKDENKFKTLLSNFNLELFEYSNYNFKEDNEENINFNSKYLMFKYSGKTRDSDLLKSQALKEIYSFFGYLTYINKFNMYTTNDHINDLSLDNAISDLKCNSLIVTNSNNEILRFGVQNDIIMSSKTLKKSKMNKLKSPELIKKFNDPNKKKITNNIKKYLYLYYLASKEHSLENSFFKFWSLSENMIKEMGEKMNDFKLKKVMENILKANSYPKYLINRVDILHSKRNDFVHETMHGEITQYDQTLVKVIAERLIEFFIEYLNDVNYFREYWTLLNYFFMTTDEKKRLIELIELTLPNYSFSLRFYSE